MGFVLKPQKGGTSDFILRKQIWRKTEWTGMLKHILPPTLEDGGWSCDLALGHLELKFPQVVNRDTNDLALLFLSSSLSSSQAVATAWATVCRSIQCLLHPQLVVPSIVENIFNCLIFHSSSILPEHTQQLCQVFLPHSSIFVTS